MLLKRTDDREVQGRFLSFEDKGYVTKGAKTKKFAVINRYNHSLLGYVKYFAQWKQYCFFPLNGILHKDNLDEVASFCRETSSAHREKRKAFPAPLEVQVVEAQP